MSENILSLTRDLCEFATGVVCDANERFFERISRELPIRIHRYPSGTNFNGWLVPQNWKVRRATISHAGRVVFDGTQNALGVAYYSKSFHAELDWEELRPHLVTNAALPEAHVFHCMWQYRPWDADWAFSVPHHLYESMEPGRYTVDLETIYEPGEMLVADCEHRGESDCTIVLNAHTCHPHMANDGFVGVATLIRLMQWLRGRRTFYSYRLVLGPEHLGTVFYLRDLPAEQIARCVAGVFLEMTGTQGPIKLASTFLGNQMIDRALRHASRHGSQGFVEVPWRCGAGNDETVWEAPGYEVPFVEMTRCLDQFAPFPEYHTNFDTPGSLNMENVDECFRVLQAAVEILEGNARIHRQFDGLICLSNPDYNLYLERPDPAVVKDMPADAEKWGHLLDSLFRYFDGTNTVLDIAERHDLSFDRLLAYLRRFEAKGLIEFERAVIPRRKARQMSRPRTVAA